MANSKRITIVSPIIVLVSIALVASFLLAAVYQMTAPVIAEREAATRNAALQQVLPDASSFTKLDTQLVNGVTEVYQADNGAGIVCSTNCKSQQGGEIAMMVGINAVGQLNGISVISHNETAGIGDKVLQDSYFERFYGIATVDDVLAVDVISGATKTSDCVIETAKVALQQYASLSAGDISPVAEFTYEEKLANAIGKLFPNSDTTPLDITLSAGVKELYKVSSEQGYVVVVDYENVIAAVAVYPDKTTGGVEVLEGEASDALLNEIKTLAVNQFN